jgi:hypothetical protein
VAKKEKADPYKIDREYEKRPAANVLDQLPWKVMNIGDSYLIRGISEKNVNILRDTIRRNQMLKKKHIRFKSYKDGAGYRFTRIAWNS